MNWYFIALGKYAVFEGRASRKEFWYFVLFDLLIMFCCFRLDIYVFTHMAKVPPVPIPIILLVYALATNIPFIAVLVRRLHDAGLSAWWLLLALAPPPLTPLGFIALLCLALLRSEPRGNKYG